MSPTSAYKVNGALAWISGMAIDADGSPHAYAPPASGLEGLDHLGNAGHPGDWWGIVTDHDGLPVEQGPTDPAPGFYISTTALVDRTKAFDDPARYVDSERTPFISIPPELRESGVRVGDVAMVLFLDKRCAAVVADIGPHGQYGEGSIALAQALGIPSSPRTGGADAGVCFVVFPGSARGWPRPQDDIESQATALFAQWGPERLIKLFGVPVVE